MSEMERADPSDFADPAPPPPPGSTIDEPVSETILRDVRLVGRRLSLVMLPGVSASARSAALRDWDLWGPLFVCMSLAVLLSVESSGEGSLLFSLIFVIVWAGAAVVTINGQLLGGRLAFFGSVCLLGYCIAPLLVAAGGCALVNATVGGGIAVVVRFALVVTGLAWSVWASSSFMADASFPEGRKLLALYPVLLFYLSLAWMVLIGFQQGPSAAVSTLPVAAPPCRRRPPRRQRW
eukprot:TRINITY_DN3116_c0_g1_i6.p1 TRINITY_DN3116_c0_g1~~TRINITY_DN3116_c0_g1_i6.p1  ORF type:complete len:236 (-),score=76.37 TRINITY_DN3116_c0_g1_i6:142-849(-)